MAKNRLAFLFDAPFDWCARYPRQGPFAPIVLVLALLLPVGVGADVFKWVDDQGKVHYGDSPPYEQDVVTIRTPPPPSGSAVLQSRSRLDGLRELGRASEREKVREKEVQAAALEQEARKRRCRDARGLLRVLELERPIFRVDERGDRAYLEDDARAVELERIDEVIKADCP